MSNKQTNKQPLKLVASRRGTYNDAPIVVNRNDVSVDGEVVLTKNDGYELEFYIQEYEQLKYELEKDKKLLYNDIKKKLKDEFGDVVFCFRIVGKGLNLTPTNYVKYKFDDLDHLSYNFSKLLIGGGKVYIEACHNGAYPMQNKSNGIFVSALGTPKILKVKWTDAFGKEIPQVRPVGAKSEAWILLHIYTEDLYGQEINVKIYDANTDSYLKAKDEDNNDLYYKTNEVNAYPMPGEAKANGSNSEKNAVGGDVAKLISNNENGKQTTQSCTNIQKSIIKIELSSFWKKREAQNDERKTLRIYPVVKIISTNEEQPYNKDYIDIDFEQEENEYKIKDSDYNDTNAVKIKVNRVEQNMARMRPCGYEQVLATTTTTTKPDEEEGDNRENIILFDQNTYDGIKPIEVVAGIEDKTKLEIKLDDKATTNNCGGFGMENGTKHNDENVFIMDNIPKDMKIVNVKTNSDWSADVGAKVTVSKKKINKKTKKEEDKQIIKVEDFYKYDNHKLYVVEKDAKHIVFYPRFVYNRGILEYLWLGNNCPTCNYTIMINSCRHGHQPIIVKAFPDIIWTIQVAYKDFDNENIESKIELVSNQTYKDTKKALYKRDKNKWLEIGDRELGVSLIAESSGMEMNVSDNIVETIKSAIEPIKEIVDFFNGTIDGKRNKNDEKYQKGITDDDRKAAAEITKRAKTRKENEEKIKEIKLRKDKELIENNRKALTQYPEGRKERRDAQKANRLLQRKLDKDASKFHVDGITRKAITFSVLWPQIAFNFTWQRKPVLDTMGKVNVDLSQTALVFGGQICCDPIIGAKIYLDFFALAERAHPVVLAVISAADIARELIADDSKMELSLTIEGLIGGSVQGYFNTLTRENSFDGAKIKGELTCTFKAAIKIKIKRKVFFINVKGEFEAELRADAVLSCTAKINYDENGFYLDPTLSFQGVMIRGEITAGAEISAGGYNIGGKASGSFEYQAIDPAEKKCGRIYL